jgi:monofunctional biosynthetic peptidoglycan transglycosylase
VKRRRSKPPRRAWRRVARAAGLLAIGWYASCLLGLVYLRIAAPLVTTVQVQRWLEARLAGRPAAWRYTFVRLERIANDLERAVVAAEDGRFYTHRGFDWVEVEKAVGDAVERRRPTRGASTITQQLVKNLYFTTHRSGLRKGLEVPLVVAAEAILPKRRILELYLNVVEWGPGVYGAEAAARYHYGVSAAQLSREQAARLAACLPAPLTRTPQRMDRYAAVILRRMNRSP